MKNEKHLVTCGDCGKLNEVNVDEEEYKCGACDYNERFTY